MIRDRGFHLALHLILFAALSLQACAAPGAGPTTEVESPGGTEAIEASPTPVKVKVVTLPFITFAPYYIAQEEGFFREQGLEVEFVNMSGNAEILPALASGQVDVSSGLLSAGFLNAIARGGNIRIVSDKGYVDPKGCINWALIGRKDLVESGELDEPAQLKGKTILSVDGTWLEYYLAKLLELGGLTTRDITKTYMNSPEVLEAFNQKQLDLAVNSEPWVTRFAEAGHVPVLTSAEELLPDATGAVMVYGPNVMGENQEVGVRFMAAYLKAVEQYNEGKTDRNLEIISSFTELEPDFLEKMCWPAIRSDGALNIESVLDFQSWAIEAEYLDSEIPVEQFFDPAFLEGATNLLEAGR